MLYLGVTQEDWDEEFLLSFLMHIGEGDLYFILTPRTFGIIPAPWTRLVKRRITFALLSLLFFVTWTLVAICGQENTISLERVQGFRQ